MKSYMGLFLVSVLLSACGGGGGGSASGGSSSSPALGGNPIGGNCGSDGVLFEDCVNSKWGVLKTFNYEVATGKSSEYTSETNAGNVQWKLVDSPAAGRNKVVEVSFGSKAGFNSQIYVNSAATDRSAYATGKIKFDVNVQRFGDAYDPNKGQMLFEVVVECMWPCLSHSAKFPVSLLNQWQTVEFNIADLVRDGLDLKNVNTGFMIRPSIDDGAQTGVVFQLDNIQWVKGTGSISSPKEIFVEHFNTEASANNWVFKNYGGGISEIHKHLSQGLGAFPQWTSSMDHWALETQLSKAINIKNKKVSMQIKLLSSIVSGFAYPMEFALVATDGAGREVSTERFSSQNMTDKVWTTLSTQVGSSFAGGFNAADVRKLAIHVYATGNPLPYGYIYLDTIRITE
jgi:hypothetical protein